MILRYSANLARKLKEFPNKSVPLDPNPYLDWTAHLFTAERTQVIIVANTVSFYCTVMYGRGMTSFSEFMRYWPGFLRDTMKYDGLQMIYDRIIGPAMGNFTISKPLNSSVTASINHFVEGAQVSLICQELSPMEVAIKLNTGIWRPEKGLISNKEVFSQMDLQHLATQKSEGSSKT
ncbi:MAG: hypothetical protein JEZ06_22715 [Anaerolineaceae bacterium]|nr:hypothetical protein [Anaerolineaceae bacterium]